MTHKLIFNATFLFLFIGALFLDSCLMKNPCGKYNPEDHILRGNFEITKVNAEVGVYYEGHALGTARENEVLHANNRFRLQIAFEKVQVALQNGSNGYYSAMACSYPMRDSTKIINSLSSVDVLALTAIPNYFEVGDTITKYMVSSIVGLPNLQEVNTQKLRWDVPRQFGLDCPIDTFTHLKFMVVARTQTGAVIDTNTVHFSVYKN